MFHTPPSKKHLKNQWRLQISSSMEKEYFVPMEKGKKKNFEKFILVKNIVKEEISPSYYAPNAEEQLSMIAPNLKCSEILGIGIICHFRPVIFC